MAQDDIIAALRKRRASDLPGYGKPSVISEALRGFAGRQPGYSVMDPQVKALQNASELGEQASIAGQYFGALSPFAAASTMASALRAGNLMSPLTVYHGSPYRFRKFDASKIGTGEGAQSYGHGLYLAEAPAVAKRYQESLSDFDMLVDGKPFNPTNPAHRAALEVKQRGGDVAIKDIVASYNQQIKDLKSRNVQWADELAKSKQEELPFIKSGKLPVYSESTKGFLYTVDLPDEQIAKMLDWDKPLNQQPKAFQDVVSSLPRFQDLYVASKTTGGEAYGELAGKLGGRDKAAESLRQAGIPGIRYLDQGSRGNYQAQTTYKGKPYGDVVSFATQKQLDDYVAEKTAEGFGVNKLPQSSNFVVFPGAESNLRIMEINGRPFVEQAVNARKRFDDSQ